MKDAVDWQYDSIQRLQFEQMRQEQYSQKTSFRIFGVQEEESEEIENKTISVIKEEIGVEVEKKEIEIVHRVGRHRDDDKPRAILVKCLSHKTKARVLRDKKKAKNITIYEDLAGGVKNLLDELISRKHELGLESVWTIDGKVRYKRVGSERINTINCHDDVMKVTARPGNS